MKSKKTILLIFIILASMILPAMAITPQSQTVKITDTHDDMFITEVGIGIDTSLVTIKDPGMDIRAFLVFRELDINYWEPLENATLRLHTSNTLDFDADSSITIYGIALSDLQLEGWLLPSTVLSLGFTSAFTDYNTSQFYGNNWFEIDVTDIIEELIRNPKWDGDGSDGTETGDAIGFHILGDEGEDTRYFYDYSVGNNLEAQLVIHWNHEPPPPSAGADPPYDSWDWEYLNTSRGIDIWTATDWGTTEAQFIGIEFATNDLWYMNTTKSLGEEYVISHNIASQPVWGGIEPLLGLDPWTLALVDNGSLKIMVSEDECLTYTLTDPNDEYSSLSIYGGNTGSIAIDQLDKNTVHLVYTSPTPAHNGVYNVIYTNFTVNPSTGALTFAPSYTNLTQVGSSQYFPTVYCQENGTLHVVYYGIQSTTVDQVWYRRRLVNGTWLSQVRVSDTDVGGTAHRYADVLANEDTGTALIVWDFDQTDVYWDVVYPNNTDDADRLANTGVLPAMVNDRENNVAQLVWASALSQPSVIYHQTKVIDNSSAWSGNMQVSPGGQKHYAPDVGIDPINRTLMSIWHNEWNNWVAGNVWNIGDVPIAGVTRLTNQRLDHNWIEEEFTRTISDQVFFTVYPNGTLTNGPHDTEEDAEIYIDNLLGSDPEDPTPPGKGWDETGPFTRFRTRLYILLMGFGLLFGPLIYFAMRRPSGYEFVIGLFIMLVGYSFLRAAAGI